MLVFVVFSFFFLFQMENVYRKEKMEDYQSEREASPGPYNGSYKTLSVDDASTGTDGFKWGPRYPRNQFRVHFPSHA